MYHSLIDGCFLNEGTIGILALSERGCSIGLINTGENFQAAKDQGLPGQPLDLCVFNLDLHRGWVKTGSKQWEFGKDITVKVKEEGSDTGL